MKNSIRNLLVTLAFFCTPLFSQTAARWDIANPGAPGVATASASGAPFFALPNVGLNWCNYPANSTGTQAAGNLTPCTNFVTTYTSPTLGTACPTSTQVVLQNSSTCQATGDNFGNLGVYYSAGSGGGSGGNTYTYTLTVGGVSYGPYTVIFSGGGGGGGSGCQTNPADGGCAINGSPSVDLFVGGIGGGTGWIEQVLANGINFSQPVNVAAPASEAGAINLGCGTDPGVGTGYTLAGSPTCAGFTPSTLYGPLNACSGYLQWTNTGSKITPSCEPSINLAGSDIGSSILGISNGGTGQSTQSGALTALLNAITRNGDLCCIWGGTAWNNLAGNNAGGGGTAFFTENGTGSPGWVVIPIPVLDGGTGLQAMNLNTVYKGNTTSSMLSTQITESGGVLNINEPLTLGTPPTVTTPGSGWYIFASEGTEPASIASGADGFVFDSVFHCPVVWNNAVEGGCTDYNPIPLTGTNQAGTDHIVSAGLGTGNATPAHVKIQSPNFSSTSGASAQTEVTTYIVHKKAGSTTSATATNLFNVALANNQTAGFYVVVHVETTQATPHNCSTTETFTAAVQETSGTVTQQTTAGPIATICDTGTLTLAVAFSTAAPSVFSVTPSWTTVVPTGVIISVEIHNLSQQEISLL